MKAAMSVRLLSELLRDWFIVMARLIVTEKGRKERKIVFNSSAADYRVILLKLLCISWSSRCLS